MQCFTRGAIPDGRVTRIDYYKDGSVVCYKSFTIPKHIFMEYHRKFRILFDFDPSAHEQRQQLAYYIKIMSNNKWDPSDAEISDLLDIR